MPVKVPKRYLIVLALAAVGAAAAAVVMTPPKPYALMAAQGSIPDHSPTANTNGGTTASGDDMDGAAIYRQHCLACHAIDGHGYDGKYPDIASDKFRKSKGNYDKAYAFISRNMPENAPASLSDKQYKAVTRYVLSLNGIPTELADIASHWAQPAISRLFDQRYVDGYTENGKLLFKPDQPITRGEFIRYFVKAKELLLSDDNSSAFTDAAKGKDAVFIQTAVDYGIVDGYDDHTFRPNKTITRAEIAAVLARSELLVKTPTNAFVDVPADSWANALIGAAVKARLFDGYEDGTFRPAANMTRGEAAAVIDRLVNPAS